MSRSIWVNWVNQGRTIWMKFVRIFVAIFLSLQPLVIASTLLDTVNVDLSIQGLLLTNNQPYSFYPSLLTLPQQTLHGNGQLLYLSESYCLSGRVKGTALF